MPQTFVPRKEPPVPSEQEPVCPQSRIWRCKLESCAPRLKQNTDSSVTCPQPSDSNGCIIYRSSYLESIAAERIRSGSKRSHLICPTTYSIARSPLLSGPQNSPTPATVAATLTCSKPHPVQPP